MADGGSDRIAGAGRLPCSVDWVAPEVPATLTRWTMRYLAATALACLGVVRCGVRASPVLTLPATCLAHGDMHRAGCRGRHQDTHVQGRLAAHPCVPCQHLSTGVGSTP